jgi:transcriptional regulator with XRE-family HTH domain
MTITRDQVRAARELLGWTQTDLAERVHLRTRAIAQFESGERRLPLFDLDGIKGIFEAAGVEFIGGDPGVRLRTINDAASGLAPQTLRP